jgi:hypothetical protein
MWKLNLLKGLEKPENRIAPDNGHSLPDPSTTAIFEGRATLPLLKV